jgi:arylformamidase
MKLRQTQTRLSCGETATSSRIDLSPHTGTHIDAPLHYARHGAAIDAVALESLVGPCHVYEHFGDHHISKDDLDAMGFVPGRRVLFKTLNSRCLREGRMDANFLSLLPEAIDRLIEANVEVLGVDGLSIGPYGEMTDRNHVAFCRSGGIVLEALDLSDVEPGNFYMIALPLKLADVEASPVRVVLIRPEGLNAVFDEVSRGA